MLTSSNAHDGKKVDVLSLDVVGQAAFILECFEKEITIRELVDAVKGEAALARAHVIFFSQMGWIRETGGERWSITQKGEKNLRLREHDQPKS